LRVSTGENHMADDTEKGNAREGEAGGLTRRSILKLSPLLLLAGCDMTPEGRTESFLRTFQKLNDWFQAKVFDRSRLSTEYSAAELTPEEGFRVNGKDDDPPDIDPATWTLAVEGLVARPGTYTLASISSLPKRVMNTRHVCVEGWSMVPRWGGTPLGEFLRMVGADPGAKYLSVESADDYTTSYDMPSALHPQTLFEQAFNVDHAGQHQQRYERIHHFNLDAQRLAGIKRRDGLKQVEQCEQRKSPEQRPAHACRPENPV